MQDSLRSEALSIYTETEQIHTPGLQGFNMQEHQSEDLYDTLVLDAKLRQSLTTVRSLGRRGKYVAAMEVANLVEKSKHIPSFLSRWCHGTYISPGYKQQTESFLAYLQQFLQAKGARTIISSSDGTIAVLRKHRTELEQMGVRLALAKEQALAIAINKDQTLQVATQLGINIPKGVALTSVEDVPAAIHEIGLPAVVKPTETWSWGSTQGTRLLCKLVTTPQEAHRAVEAITQQGGKLLFQQFLPGRQESVSFMYAHNTICARFAQWTLRTQPPLGGVSTYRQSISMPEDTGNQAEKLIREIELEGYSQIQFRRDAAGIPYLMEINPRLTSGIEIAVRAGVDFPYLLYQWATGEQVDYITGYRTGGRMRYLEGDLLTTLQTFAQRGRPGVTPPTKAVLEFFASFFVPTGYDYFDWRDLRPLRAATGEFIDRIKYQLKKRI